MIRQVRLNTAGVPRRVFAFGTHDLALATEVKENVTNAVVIGQELRLIIDELLVGNNLEEVACRDIVDDDSFSRVPLGATPDDIANCSAPDNALPSVCKGDRAVCVCELPGGCLRANGEMVEQGKSVGVLDLNQDGGADDTAFIDNSIGIECDGNQVPMSLNGDNTGSYWNPSGNQQRPAQGGFDALGPAVVLKTAAPLPTNSECRITAAANIVDKENLQLCAPPNGDITQSCTPGDLSAFSFSTEPLNFVPASWINNAMNVSRTADATFASNTLLAPPVAGAITVAVDGGAAITNFTLALDMSRQNIVVTWTNGGLAANTKFNVTLTNLAADTYMKGPPSPITFSFTTGAN
jgi:hypothetical protein